MSPYIYLKVIEVKVIKEFEGDGGNLRLVMLKKDKKYYVNVIVFNEKRIVSKYFYKRKNTEKYYKKVMEEF